MSPSSSDTLEFRYLPYLSQVHHWSTAHIFIIIKFEVLVPVCHDLFPMIKKIDVVQLLLSEGDSLDSDS